MILIKIGFFFFCNFILKFKTTVRDSHASGWAVPTRESLNQFPFPQKLIRKFRNRLRLAGFSFNLNVKYLFEREVRVAYSSTILFPYKTEKNFNFFPPPPTPPPAEGSKLRILIFATRLVSAIFGRFSCFVVVWLSASLHFPSSSPLPASSPHLPTHILQSRTPFHVTRYVNPIFVKSCFQFPIFVRRIALQRRKLFPNR